jgi:hypothetical protein
LPVDLLLEGEKPPKKNPLEKNPPKCFFVGKKGTKCRHISKEKINSESFY